jgi:hypothetical protein
MDASAAGDKNGVAEYVEAAEDESLQDAIKGRELPLIVKLGDTLYAVFADDKGNAVIMKMTPQDTFCSVCQRLTIDPYGLTRSYLTPIFEVRKPRPATYEFAQQNTGLCYKCLSTNFQAMHEAGWDFVSPRGRKAFPLPIRDVKGTTWSKGWPLPQGWNQASSLEFVRYNALAQAMDWQEGDIEKRVTQDLLRLGPRCQKIRVVGPWPAGFAERLRTTLQQDVRGAVLSAAGAILRVSFQ